MSRWHWVGQLALGCAMTAAGCSDGDTPIDTPIDAADAADAASDRATDAPTSATETIGADGGVVTLGAARVEIPRGALVDPVPITVWIVGPVPPPYRAYSPLYRFAPAGLQFRVPVSVTLPFAGDGARAALFWSAVSGDGYERVAGARVAGATIRGDVAHFSTGFVADGELPPGDAGRDVGPDDAPIVERDVGPTDGGIDAGSDVGIDVVVRDAGPDDATIVERDVGPTDGGIDAGIEVGIDVGIDVVVRDGATDDGEAGPSDTGTDLGVADTPPIDASVPCSDAGCAAAVVLRGPMSGSIATSRRPTLRWDPAVPPGADAVRVQICTTRDCTVVEQTLDSTTGRASPGSDLAPGAHFWRALPTLGGAINGPPSTPWMIAVGARSAPTDTAWGSVFDVNGDGYSDLAVTAAGHPGIVRVYHGGAGGLSTTPATVIDNPFLGPNGLPYYDWRAIANAGDLNGDGYTDFIAGAPLVDGLRTGIGRVAYYFGGPSGLGATPSSTVFSQWGAEPNVLFGEAVTGVGDIDGNGCGDFLVGAPGRNAERGSVFIGYGCGAPTGAARELDYHRDVFETPLPSPMFGSAIAAAGDVNADGYADVLVGLPDRPGALFSRVDLFLGAATGLPTTPSAKITGTGLGRRMAGAGDVNGDGYADVILGSGGDVLLYLGGAGGLAPTPAATLSGLGASAGKAIGPAGDVNRDGYADVAIAGHNAAGDPQVYVFLGSATGLAATPAWTINAPDGSATDFGVMLVSAGDVNGDGLADLAAGALTVPSTDGRVYLFSGTATGLGLTPVVTINGTDSTFRQAGFSYLAGAVR